MCRLIVSEIHSNLQKGKQNQKTRILPGHRKKLQGRIIWHTVNTDTTDDLGIPGNGIALISKKQPNPNPQTMHERSLFWVLDQGDSFRSVRLIKKNLLLF